MTEGTNMVLGLVVGVALTLIVPFAVAAPRLKREYREQRKQWLRDHPEWEDPAGDAAPESLQDTAPD